MRTSNEADPNVTPRRSPWRWLLSWMLPTIGSVLISGVLLGAVGYYHDVRDDDGAALVFATVAILTFLVAGFLAARGAGHALVGALTGLASGTLGAVCGLFILQQVGDANAASQTIPALIAWPLAGLIVGLIAGYVGANSAARHAIGDEYEGEVVTLRPPLVPSHRTWRAQGTDYPQGDRPSF